MQQFFPAGLFAQGVAIPGLLRLRTYRSEVVRDAPVMYFRFSELDGTFAQDIMRATYGTYTGGFTLGVESALKGDSSRAVTLNGSTGLVQIAAFTAFPAGSWPRSVECWLKYSNLGGTILGYGNAATAGQEFNLQIYNGAGTWYLFNDGTNNATNNNNLIISAGELPAAGIWHHLVFTLITDTAWKAYLNGDAWKSGTFGTPINTAAVSAAEIGDRVDVGGQNFDGSLDEVAIYDYALSAQRIRAHYFAGRGFFV